MEGRWIKMYESLLDDSIWQMLTGNQPKAFIGLLLSVNWQPSEFGCRNCKASFSIPAGGTAKSVKSLAARADVTSGCMKGLLRLLVKNGFLASEGRPRCHCIHVVKNWEKYQDGQRPQIQDPTQQRPRTRPSNDPGAAPEVEVKKEKKEDVGLLFDDPYQPNKVEYELADRQRQLHKEALPGTLKPIKQDSSWLKGKHRPKWAKPYQQLRGEVERADIERAQDLVYRAKAATTWNDSLLWVDIMESATNPAESLCKNLSKILRSQPQQRLITDPAESHRQAVALGFPVDE